jgi:DNA-binding response OmpR family regulator
MANILVVANSSETAGGLQAFLEQCGFTVFCAGSGMEAIEQLRFGDWDLALCEDRLPDMSGLDVCRTHRRLGGKAPVIVMLERTAAYANDREEALRAGAQDCLPRPCECDEIADCISRVLD